MRCRQLIALAITCVVMMALFVDTTGATSKSKKKKILKGLLVAGAGIAALKPKFIPVPIFIPYHGFGHHEFGFGGFHKGGGIHHGGIGGFGGGIHGGGIF